MGRVYRALDRLTGQTIALKQVTAPTPALVFGSVQRAPAPVVASPAAPRFSPAEATTVFTVTGAGPRNARVPTGSDTTVSVLDDGPTPPNESGERAVSERVSEETAQRLRLALAQEWKTLASLRHPNIITVRDYGFGEDGQPFFTMDYLENAVPLIESAYFRPLAGKVDLLVQTLQALDYLHRQGILHRDLKPANVLVAGDVVKVLDFGLALKAGHTFTRGEISGTIPFMAPELFRGEAPSKAADLYALGLIAFEIFTGTRLAKESDLRGIVAGLGRRLADVEAAGLDPALTRVMLWLLAHRPEDRPRSAREAIVALCDATGQPAPKETREIRDSYLQAAQFVGREPEMATLTTALDEAIAGRGGTWLLGGESGVGKSRLTDELRTLALVRGAHVFRGRSVERGGDTYDVWRDVLRPLALIANPDDAEAAVLRPILPGLEALLERPIPAAPPLDPQSSALRLVETITNLLRRAGAPILLLLEDMHWASADTIGLVGRLQRAVESMPVLMFVTYRDDERPELPSQLASARVMPLKRLSREEVASLSESMLGAAGRSGPVIDYLHRETEGNVFFLVEVVRSLADEAGALEEVASRELPAGVSSMDLRRLLRRRLSRVPSEGRALLSLAAVSGRRVDRAVLSWLAPDADIDRWLQLCGDAAVLSVEDEYWQFAHDKLREEVVAEIEPVALRGLHRRVAEGIEAVWGEFPERAPALAYHWSAAGDPDKELLHTERAARHAAGNNANVEAAGYYRRALELLLATPESPERAGRELGLQLGLGGVSMASRGFGAPEVERAFGRALEIARQSSGSPLLFPVLWGLWSFNTVCGNLGVAEDLTAQFRTLAESTGSDTMLFAASHLGGVNQFWRGRAPEARKSLKVFLDNARREDPLFQVAPGEDPEVSCLVYSGWALWLLGYPDQSVEHCLRAVELSRSMSAHTQAFALGFSTWAHQFGGMESLVRERADASIALATKQEFPFWLSAALIARGWISARAGDPAQGIEQIRTGLDIYRATGARVFKPSFLAALAEASILGRRFDDAQRAIEEAHAEMPVTGERVHEPELWRLEATLHIARGDTTAALASLARAISAARAGGALSFELRAATTLAEVLLSTGQRDEARSTLEPVLARMTEGFGTPDLVRARATLESLRGTVHSTTTREPA